MIAIAIAIVSQHRVDGQNPPGADWAAVISESKSFEDRQRAMIELWADYANSRDLVAELARSPDPETARRARWILDRWELGLLPELPRSVRRQLAAVDGNAAVAFETLLDEQRVREAVEVARHAMLTQGSEQVRSEIAEVVTRRYVQLIRYAKQFDQMPLILDLLELSAETPALAVARVLLWERLGRNLDEASILPACAKNWSLTNRLETSATCWGVLGDFDRSIAMAKQLPEPTLLARILLLAGRWTELAELASQSVEDDLPIEATITQHTMWLVAARQAGLTEQVRQTADKIASGRMASGSHWRALAVAGQIGLAIDVAKPIDVPATVDLLQTQMRHSEAFALLEVNPANPMPGVQRMIDELAERLEEPTSPQRNRLAEQDATETLMATVLLLNAVGSNELVRPILLRIANLPGVGPRAESDTESNEIQRQVVATARRVGAVDIIPEVLAASGDPVALANNRYYGYILANRSPRLFRNLAAGVASVRGSESRQAKWRALLDLVAGELPAGWDRYTDLNDLADALLTTSEKESLQSPNRVSFLAGDMFALLGRDDLAKRVYRHVAETTKNPLAILGLAQRELAAGESESALGHFELATERIHQVYRTNELATLFEPDPWDASTPSTAAALLGQSLALRQLGRIDDARLIDETLDLIPLQPHADSGDDYLDRLESMGQQQRRREVAVHELRFAALQRSQNSGLYGQAFDYAVSVAETDPAAAARWIRIAVLSTLDTPVLYPSAYATVPGMWYALDAVAAAESGDREATAKALESAAIQFPMDITMAEEQLPRIRQAGMEDLADQALDRVFNTGLEYLERFPGDANASNNLAWVASISGRHYEQSLQLASRAVFLEPDSVSYRDTLAEVLFRMGDAAQAIRLEQQCLLDAPDHWHLHEQIERFGQSDSELSRPE
jgi:tetratricopeptide (TPR) repeat protein